MKKTENQRIKELREVLKLTQVQLADFLGVSKQYFYRVEKGLTDLSKEKIVTLCVKYNVSIDWLLTGRGQMFLNKEPDNVMTVELNAGQELRVIRRD